MHAPHNKRLFSRESGILSTIKTGSCKGVCQDSDWKRKIIRPLAAPLRLTAVTEFYFGKFFDFVTSSLHFTLTNLFHSIHWHHFALHSFTHPFNSITSLHTSALEWDRVICYQGVWNLDWDYFTHRATTTPHPVDSRNFSLFQSASPIRCLL